MKTACKIFTAALMIMTLAAGSTRAQGVKDQIVGTWLVVTVVNETDGKKLELFGSEPKGQFIFTADGHFSTNIVRPGRPKFASKDRMNGTADENKDAVQGNISSFGTYALNSDGSLNVEIVGSSYPNWDGAKQKRLVQVKGDELTWTNPTPSSGQNAVLTLKRAK